jgi:divalent metal cation (Fe/Co/Zn/Cd) transporter
MAVEIYQNALNQLLDCSASPETIKKIESIVISVDGVLSIDKLKTRIHANKIYVDVEISVNKELSIVKAHEISENVHNELECNLKEIKHCMVHVNPSS